MYCAKTLRYSSYSGQSTGPSGQRAPSAAIRRVAPRERKFLYVWCRGDGMRCCMGSSWVEPCARAADDPTDPAANTYRLWSGHSFTHGRVSRGAQSRSLHVLPFAVRDDGTEHFLLKFEGTIPIVVRDNTYNIPVCIWVDELYPQRPPMPYVTPTKGMWQLRIPAPLAARRVDPRFLSKHSANGDSTPHHTQYTLNPCFSRPNSTCNHAPGAQTCLYPQSTSTWTQQARCTTRISRPGAHP